MIMPMLVNLTNIISLRIRDLLIKFRVIVDLSISLTILTRIVNQVQYPLFLGMIMPMLVNLTSIISLCIRDWLIKFRVIADIDSTGRYH